MLDIRKIDETNAEISMAPQDKIKIILNDGKEVALMALSPKVNLKIFLVIN